MPFMYSPEPKPRRPQPIRRMLFTLVLLAAMGGCGFGFAITIRALMDHGWSGVDDRPSDSASLHG
jgi:hypothetical protein